MNLVDAVVVEILDKPYEQYGMWWVRVKYDSWGVISETQVMAKTLQDAEKITVGYKFLT